MRAPTDDISEELYGLWLSWRGTLPTLRGSCDVGTAGAEGIIKAIRREGGGGGIIIIAYVFHAALSCQTIHHAPSRGRGAAPR